MSIERAKGYLRQYGMEDRVRETELSSATVELEQCSGYLEWIDVCKLKE